MHVSMFVVMLLEVGVMVCYDTTRDPEASGCSMRYMHGKAPSISFGHTCSAYTELAEPSTSAR